MTNIAIDPCILAYPRDTDSVDAYKFENYIETIIEIDNIKKQKNLNFVISSNTPDLLVIENNFPYWENLNKVLINSGLNSFYQPRDIITTLEAILKYTTMENLLEIDDILFSSVNIDPNVIEENKEDSYIEELKRLLIYICIAFDEGHNNLLMTEELANNVLAVTGEVSLIQRMGGQMDETTKIYSSNIVTAHTTDQLFLELDPIQIWKNGIEDYDFDNAIYIYIFQRTGRHLEEKNWSFGKEFLAKLNSHGFLHEKSKIKSLLKSLGDAILLENNTATHALRTGEGGNNPQVTRGDDKAYRRDIDYEYHLHYWELDGEIEFASVGVHSDMRIPR